MEEAETLRRLQRMSSADRRSSPAPVGVGFIRAPLQLAVLCRCPGLVAHFAKPIGLAGVLFDERSTRRTCSDADAHLLACTLSGVRVYLTSHRMIPSPIQLHLASCILPFHSSRLACFVTLAAPRLGTRLSPVRRQPVGACPPIINQHWPQLPQPPPPQCLV